MIKNIDGAGAKLVKSFWKLEFAQNKKEVDRIYRESNGLINYWNMKEWIKFPNIPGLPGIPHF